MGVAGCPGHGGIGSTMRELAPKGFMGGRCARTNCNNHPAIFYNRGSMQCYCEKCAEIINANNGPWEDGKPLCIVPLIKAIDVLS